MSEVRVINPVRKTGRKRRMGVYARVSTDSSDQLNSYAAQIGYYSKMVADNPDWELVDVYADEGISGMQLNHRDEFYRMMEDARRGRLDEILCKSVSRFARNTRDCLVALRELKSLGVTVKCEKENIDTGTLTTEIMVSVSGSLAQEESVSMSKNMRWSYQKRMQSGKFITTTAPFGYRLQNGKELVICEREAEFVRWIFRNYLDGMNMIELAEAMTQTRIPTSEGKAYWQYSTIHYLLRNEKYIGDSLNQKSFTTETFPFKEIDNQGQRPQYYATDTHPAIIDKDTYYKVQALIKSRCPTGGATGTSYPLSKKMTCGNCGTTFMRRKTTNGIIMWACRKHESGKDKCHVGRIPESEIYAAFVRMCKRLQANAERVITPAITQLQTVEAAISREDELLKSMGGEIARLTEQLHSLSQLKVRGLINAESFMERSNTLNMQLAELKHKRRLRCETKDETDTLEKLRELRRIIMNADIMDDFDREMFDELIDRVIVDSQEQIRFRFLCGLTLTEQIKGKIR